MRWLGQLSEAGLRGPCVYHGCGSRGRGLGSIRYGVSVWIAFGLTAAAGMATAIGSLIAFTAKGTDYRFLSVATGFSAGVMLYISFVEILPKGADALVQHYGESGS